jgi:hypothetical protein
MVTMNGIDVDRSKNTKVGRLPLTIGLFFCVGRFLATLQGCLNLATTANLYFAQNRRMNHKGF